MLIAQFSDAYRTENGGWDGETWIRGRVYEDPAGYSPGTFGASITILGNTWTDDGWSSVDEAKKAAKKLLTSLKKNGVIHRPVKPKWETP